MSQQEELEQEFFSGSSNEFQNALALSKSELDTDDSDLIKQEKAKGNYVVVMTVDNYCRFTDAFISVHYYLAYSGTKADCEWIMKDRNSDNFGIEPPQIVEIIVNEVVKQLNNDDVPF